MNLLLILLGSCRSLAAAAAGLARLRGGGRVLGRGPAGRRADDAAVVVLLVQGDLASTVTAVYLCLRISASASSGSWGALGSTQLLRKRTSTMARHFWRNTEKYSTRVRYRWPKLFCP